MTKQQWISAVLVASTATLILADATTLFANGGLFFAPAAQGPVDLVYFGRGDQQTMLNFRVTDLDAMLTQLRAAGALIDDEISEASFGRFGHAVDAASSSST